MRTYTVHLDTPEAAEAFARDFDGVSSGNSVTVVAKQGLEAIFMNYYGGEQNV